MLLKSGEIEIDKVNPFENDALDRKESAEILKNFVLLAKDPLVVCIDAPWGQGKTTFLKMWEQLLKNDDIPTIYFNAWENDFSDSALVSLIGEISASIKDLSEMGDKDKAKKHLGRIGTLGTALVKQVPAAMAKIAIEKGLNIDSATQQNFVDSVKSVGKEQPVKEQLAQYEKSKKVIKFFRKALSSLVSSITNPKDPKPLVFIIDELDRCRPNYAIEILEKAKHFFNAKNIIFVLGADKEQLGFSIQAIYGERLNVDGYLRRFIDFDYALPAPDKGLFVNALFEKFGFNKYFSEINNSPFIDEGKQSLLMFSDLFRIYDLTLREQEHCCSWLSLSIATTLKNEKLFPPLLCFFIVLKIKHQELYKEFINHKINSLDLLDKLRDTHGFNDLLLTKHGTLLEAYIITCTSSNKQDSKIIDEYQKEFNGGAISRERQRRAQGILITIDDYIQNEEIEMPDYVLKKIEIISRFEA